MQGSGLSIRGDLLNKYAEIVNYSNNSMQDSLASVDLLDKKQQESVQVENKLDYIWSKLFV
jgi:hypothetical protein